jgi:Taurine catabolism dioxygenase TauD, TfdA family
MAGDFPFFIELVGGRDPNVWVASNKTYIDDVLDRCGAVLLRGFDISAEQDFAGLVPAYSPKVTEYTYRSTSRPNLGAGIYTPTKHPAGLSIAHHNENAYQRN